jgi:hypothetical protein
MPELAKLPRIFAILGNLRPGAQIAVHGLKRGEIPFGAFGRRPAAASLSGRPAGEYDYRGRLRLLVVPTPLSAVSCASMPARPAPGISSASIQSLSDRASNHGVGTFYHESARGLLSVDD